MKINTGSTNSYELNLQYICFLFTYYVFYNPVSLTSTQTNSLSFLLLWATIKQHTIKTIAFGKEQAMPILLSHPMELHLFIRPIRSNLIGTTWPTSTPTRKTHVQFLTGNMG